MQHQICRSSDLIAGEGKPFKAGYELIAVFRTADGALYAVENSCPHAGAPLDDGPLEGGEVMCDWHGWRFRLSDGECLTCPGQSLKTYPIHEADGLVYVETDSAPPT